MRTTPATQETRTITKVALAAAAAALFVSACGSSASSSDGTSATTPAGEAGAATSDGTVTVDETAPDAAPVAGDDPVVNGETDAPVPTYEIDEALAAQQLLPASGVELPCLEYVEVADSPLFPCDRGPLVADLQEALAGYEDVRIDSFFGTQTVEAVQRSLGLYDTGIVDQLFIELIDPGDGSDDVVIESGLTATDIAALCTTIIEQGSPDVSDFESDLCMRHGYLPISTGE